MGTSPGFSRAQLESFRGTEVDHLVGDHVRLVFVGINPGLMTAATNTHFAHPSNRFHPALYAAGIIPVELPNDGLSHSQRQVLTDRGIAITNIVAHATARASELSREDYRVGARELEARITAWQPEVVAILGLTAYRTAFARPGALAGEQPEGLGGARLWVLGNPSGLNAHETVASLARAYREPAVAAGLDLDPLRV